MARHSARVLPDGVRLIYDPAIRIPFAEAAAGDTDMWAVYDRVRCPTLVTRGADSRLLLPETADAMTQRGPRARVETFPGVGHAPALAAPDQIDAIRRFLAL